MATTGRLEKMCVVCGAPFITRSVGLNAARQKFCGDACRKRAGAGHWAPRPNEAKICTGNVGAAHEMIVCADLLKRGFDVFRGVSPASKADLVAIRGASALRVQVKTGIRNTNGRLHCWSKDHESWDVLAIVEWDNRITYEPPLVAADGAGATGDPS